MWMFHWFPRQKKDSAREDKGSRLKTEYAKRYVATSYQFFTTSDNFKSVHLFNELYDVPQDQEKDERRAGSTAWSIQDHCPS